jgi:hypothetical protein
MRLMTVVDLSAEIDVALAPVFSLFQYIALLRAKQALKGDEGTLSS